MTPEQRRLRAKIAANARWSQPMARADQAEAARSAILARLERQVDPELCLPPDERTLLVRAAARRLSAKLNAARARRRAIALLFRTTVKCTPAPVCHPFLVIRLGRCQLCKAVKSSVKFCCAARGVKIMPRSPQDPQLACAVRATCPRRQTYGQSPRHTAYPALRTLLSSIPENGNSVAILILGG
jgi:hypothetical protein